ncbi:MAG TPA: DUF4349 domain-containing protein [bacterium]|nr:DUF4349 domain-containing protein [bacterium]
MMTHPLVEILSGYLDGQVAAEERRRIEAHLAECATCRETLGGLRQTVAAVQGLEQVGVPAGLRAAVIARLEGEQASRGRDSVVRRWLAVLRPPTWRTAVAAAAVVLVGLFSINLLGQFTGRNQQFAARDAGEGQSRRALEGGDRPNSRPIAGVQPVGTAAPGSQAPAARTPAAPGVSRQTIGRQIVHGATLGVEVVSFEDGSRALVRIAESTGGFVSDSTAAQAEPPSGTFTLRVPASRFSEALEQVEALGKVTGRQVRGEDVTEEFVDLQARIRNLEAHERQLITFMDRATRVPDLLAIEQELTRVRGEIEQLTGRLRFLANRVEMSTIQVTLREKGKQGGAIWDFGASLLKVRAAFLGTVRQVLVGAERLLVLAGALVPLAILVMAGWWVIRRVVHRGVGAA